MNRKNIIYCSFILSAVLLTGCGCGQPNNQPPSSVTPESSTPVSETEPSTSQTQDDTTTMISPEEAKAIALQHANLVEEEVTISKCELDEDFDGPNYDVEFYTEDRIEYDYEIDAFTGDILGYDWDGDDTLFTDSTEESNTAASANGDIANNSHNPTDTMITEDAAKQIALEQVSGASAEHIREFDRDYDDGKLKYEVEIFFEDKEYTFDIDARDGAILEREAE